MGTVLDTGATGMNPSALVLARQFQCSGETDREPAIPVRCCQDSDGAEGESFQEMTCVTREVSRVKCAGVQEGVRGASHD